MAFDRTKTVRDAERFVKSGKLTEAITEYRKLADDNSRDMNVINKLGDLLFRAGKTQEALRYFLRIAEYYAKDGFFLKAIAMYKKIAKIEPSNMDCQQRLASLYQQQGLTMEAKAQFLQVADHLVKAGKLQQAAEVLPKIIELEPENLKIRMTYADLLTRTGNPGGAAREFFRIAGELNSKGSVDEAIKIAQRGIKADPEC